MRKVLLFLVLFFYLIPAIGFSVDAHWCGKKLKIVSIDASHEKKCLCSKKKMNMGCCSDVHIKVKLVENYKNSPELKTPSVSSLALFIENLFLNESLYCDLKIVFDFPSYHAPPFINKEPVYLQNNVFRI